MRRATVYILILTMIFSVMLSGCVENRTGGNKVTESAAPKGTAVPEASTVPTVLPESMMPDVEDGVVKDDDGIITDADTGNTAADNRIPAGENSMDGKTGNSVGTGTTPAPAAP